MVQTDKAICYSASPGEGGREERGKEREGREYRIPPTGVWRE